MMHAVFVSFGPLSLVFLVLFLVSRIRFKKHEFWPLQIALNRSELRREWFWCKHCGKRELVYPTELEILPKRRARCQYGVLTATGEALKDLAFHVRHRFAYERVGAIDCLRQRPRSVVVPSVYQLEQATKLEQTAVVS